MHTDLEVEQLLASYPRSRPPLSPGHKASYVEHYRANRSGQGLAGAVVRLESWMHRAISRDHSRGEVLEIGAGNLNHLPYCPGSDGYDVVEPFRELWLDSPSRSCVRKFYADINDIPTQQRYDQVLSVAVLEHLTHLPWVLARSGLLLRESGSFRAGFPSEGGLLWGVAWRSTTAVAYRLRRGLNYGAIMHHEHINTAVEILALLGYFYAEVEIGRFPFPFHHLSFYTVAIARSPRLGRCQTWAIGQQPRLTVPTEAS
jgi:hypothetical protein